MKRRIGISTKVSLGFIILAAMLFISGALSIHELTLMGKDIRRLLDDSYSSVKYSKAMIVALDAQRKSMLRYLTEERDSTTRISPEFLSADREFRASLALAQSSLVNQEEAPLVDSIRVFYADFAEAAQAFVSDSSSTLSEYFAHVAPLMQDVVRSITHLLTMKQQAVYAKSTILEDSASRALRPGLIIIVVGILFTLMFTYLLRHFYVSPIKKMGRNIRTYLSVGRYSPLQMVADDELHDLSDAVDDLVQYARQKTKEAQRKDS